MENNEQKVKNGANTYRITIEVIGQEEEGIEYKGPFVVEANGFSLIRSYFDEDHDECLSVMNQRIKGSTIMQAIDKTDSFKKAAIYTLIRKLMKIAGEMGSDDEP